MHTTERFCISVGHGAACKRNKARPKKQEVKFKANMTAHFVCSHIRLKLKLLSILQPLSNKRFRKNATTHTGKHQENFKKIHPISIQRIPRFRSEMGARGTPQPQKLSYISQVQPQIEFSIIFDQFLPPFWKPLGTLGATFARPWPPLDALFCDFFAVFVLSLVFPSILHEIWTRF